MLDNILQNGWLIACIGGIVVLVIGYMIVRSLFRARTPRSSGRDESMWNRQGSERPKYDDDRIESSGGIGGSPSRSSRRSRPFSTGTTSRDLDGSRRGSGPAGTRSRRARRDNDRDDNDVQSRGGFGK